MLISYPFLPRSAGGSFDDTYEQSILDLEMLYTGVYPSSYEREWHGGIHVQSNAWEPVRAIADGVLVAYRLSDDLLKERDDDETGRIDNSFVLLKHEMEADSVTANDSDTPVKAVFYSLYMHLANNKEYKSSIVHSASYTRHAAIRQVGPNVQIDGKTKISRKDVLGFPGQSYMNYNVIHFEIFTTDEALNNFFVNSKTASEIGTKGTWGDSYFIVKANAAAVAEHPFLTKRNAAAATAAAQSPTPASAPATTPAGAHAHHHAHHPAHPAAHPLNPKQIGNHDFPLGTAGTTAQNLFVRISFRNGAKYATTWLDQGDGKAPTLLTSKQGDQDIDYEYDLYGIATEAYPGCPSAGYELQRLGKVLGPDSIVAAENQNWQLLTYAEGQQGYIDLADASVQVLSDADFPHWLGWQKVEGGLFPESGQCNMLSMLDLLGVERDLGGTKPDASNGNSGTLGIARDVDDNQVASQELKNFFSIHPHVRDWAQRLVCKFPSEWDKGNNGRWVKLKQKDGLGPGVDGPYLGNDDEYNKHIKFLESLQWWTDAGMGDSNVWHFHPFRFIQQFRKCAWLTETDITRLFPPTAMRASSHSHWVSEGVTPPARKISDSYLNLNKTARKFGITTPSRMAAFYANAMVETQWFNLMREAHAESKKYFPWSGSGFLQLTWPDNYIKYWRFRGRQVDQALADRLSAAAAQASSTDSNVPLTDSTNHVPSDMVDWRDDIERLASDASDSAGAYWAWSGAAKPADDTPVMVRQTKLVGNIDKPYYCCESFGKVAETVNFGCPFNDVNKINSVNGIVPRFQAYAKSIWVLADLVWFPAASIGDNPQEFPDM